MPFDTVSNGTVIPSATRTSTADAVVKAGISLTAGVLNASETVEAAGAQAVALASVPALLPSPDVNNIITSSPPPSTTITTMLPSETLPSGAPALKLPYQIYYSNSS
ncbi:MAG: hypothetical protein LQ347_000997, partial [Umbilicaria vellea]